MTRDEALHQLHARLPKSATFSLFRHEQISAWVEYETSGRRRVSVDRFDTTAKWSVVIQTASGCFHCFDNQSLETVVEEAASGWDSQEKPPLLEAPGRSERADQGDREARAS